MPEKSNISQLISSLHKGEARYVQAHLNGQKLALFNFLRSKKDAEISDIAHLFPGRPATAIATVRAQLESKVAGLIGEYWAVKSPRRQIENLKTQGQGFLMKGMVEDGLRAFQAAFKIAVEVEEMGTALSLAAYESLYSLEPMPAQGVDRIEAAALLPLRRDMAAIEQALDQLAEALTVKRMPHSQRKEIAEAKLKELGEVESTFPVKAFLFRSRTAAIYFGISGYHIPASEHLEKAIAAFRQRPFLAFDPIVLESVIAVHLSLGGFWTLSGNPKSARQLIEHLSELIHGMGIQDGGLLAPAVLRFELEIHLKEMDRERFMVTVQSMDPKGELWRSSDQKRKAQLIILVINGLFRFKEFGQIPHWVSEILNHSLYPPRTDFLIAAHLYKMVALFEVGEYDYLFAWTRRVTYALKRLQIPQKDFQGIVKAFRSLSQANTPVFQKKNLAILVGIPQTLDPDSPMRAVFRIFNLAEWAANKAL